MTDSELKLEAHRLRVAFNNKGIKHIWDFVQAFYPDQYDKDDFQKFINCRESNVEFVTILEDVLNRIS